ncbi:Ribosomal RNA small subunit methyltransferase H [Anaerolineae bacterium]|nr:Ribosomal RNA small subunit methyltransferase H [Anaerolineae bacterium]
MIVPMPPTTTPSAHIPVLLEAVLKGLNPHQQSRGKYVDGTVGAGGHAAALLTQAVDAVLLAIDRDPRSLAVAQETLAPFGDRVHFAQGSYELLPHFAAEIGFEPGQIDGILLDLGIASMHVDDPQRGFSFRTEAPLDMRFDPSSGLPTAADLLNTLDAESLAHILFSYGEERESRRIAKAVIAARPLRTTTQLANLIASVVHSTDHLHPATRTFQALRIAVNDELGAVERTLPLALKTLKPGGRLAVISFHSLEDRIIKTYFHTEARDCLCPPKQIICTCGHRASIREITRKPIVPDETEIRANPRSRSAKLRIAEKLIRSEGSHE